MKHYDHIDRIQDDGTLMGDFVCGFNKLDGQNFCVKFNTRTKAYGQFGSRKMEVDETSEQFSDAVRYFKENKFSDILTDIYLKNSKKKGVYNSVDEITYFFEWYVDNSFTGFHQPSDTLRLALIDVFIKKKGYMEPGIFYDLYSDCGIELPELIYKGTLDNNIIENIRNNDYTKPDAKYLQVKDGVVFKRSTLLKGQRRPSVKVKTGWWLTELHKKYSEDMCRILE